MVVPGDVDVTVHDRIPTDGLTREDARGLATRVRTQSRAWLMRSLHRS